VIRSAGGAEFPFPQVVRLMQMVSFKGMREGSAPFTRAGLRVRDNARCQVSDCSAAGETVDHVLPRSKGGGNSWENCVLMCRDHNARKGDRTLRELGWTLKRVPAAPVGVIALLPKMRPEWAAWVSAH